MEQLYPHIFSPITIGGKVFKNRVWTAPAGVHLLCGDEAYPNDITTAYYARKAEGGVAVVTLGGQIVNFDDDTRQRSVHDRYDILLPRYHRFWYMWNDTMHQYDAKTSLEVMCFAGGGRGPNGDPIEYTVNTPPREARQRQKRIERDEMEFLAAKFARVAEAAVDSGFDMLLMHFAHGFLISQFLSRFNQREDEFGPQSIENRCRFADMIIDAIRKKVGRALLLEVRLTGSEYDANGYDARGCAEFVKHFQDRIDIAHISHMGLGPLPNSFFVSETFREEGYVADNTAIIKSTPGVKIPVLAVGGFQTPAAIERVLAEGKADIVAMARGVIADPARVNKTKYGHEDEIVPCIHCGYCISYDSAPAFACSANPETGRELRLPMLAGGDAGAKKKKKVAVIGGGPAGMYAAFTAAGSGHDVTLFEKSGALGGLIKSTEHIPFKRNVRMFLEYERNMTAKRCVRVLLNTEATREAIERLAPDAIIVAVGGRVKTPAIPGVDGPNVYGVDRFADWVETDAFAADAVAVVGGGVAGCEIALFLGMYQGKKVTLLEMADVLMQGDNGTEANGMREKLKEYVMCELNAKVREIRPGVVVYEDAAGSVNEAAAGAVILCSGIADAVSDAEAFRGLAERFVSVGDCVTPSNIRNAALMGWRAAIAL